MLNHFRTVLLNLPYAGDPTEHIPKDFGGVSLLAPFKEIYQVLFPKATSRYYKLFLAHNYQKAVEAAGLGNDLKKYDARMSYTGEYSDFFKIYRHSNPAVSNPLHPLFVYGHYTGTENSSNFYDNYRITQVDDTLKVLLYSTVKELYIKGNQTFEEPESDAEILLDFTSGNSAPVLIGSTGISFSIAGGSTFADTSDKVWEFLVEAPFNLNFSILVKQLETVNTAALFAYKPKVDVRSYQNLWLTHFNPVYRIAGLLLAYVAKLSA